MTKNELTEKIYFSSHLTGEFWLRSGKTSTEYFDKYMFESDPAILKEIAEHLAALIPPETEVLAGLEMGGIPIATALSLKTGIPAIFVRKQAKEYGTCKIAEGITFAGKNVCIIEDVVTTAGAVIDGFNELKRKNAVINNVMCVIERESSGRKNLQDLGLQLISLLTMDELNKNKIL
jgi:orotate phosphoribosyltransferase